MSTEDSPLSLSEQQRQFDMRTDYIRRELVRFWQANMAFLRIAYGVSEGS